MGLIMNKKGVVFTVLAVVTAIFFTLIFSARIEKPIDYKTTLIETRIGVLNNYMSNFFDYAEGTASISGYSALQGVIQDLNNMKAYNTNFESQYAYCIITGNLTSSKVCPGMANKTLTYYLNRIKNIAEEELHTTSDYKINSIDITQTTEAFLIDVIVNLSLNINDTYANISNTLLVTSSVSINQLLDPLYLLNGTYNQTIKKTTIKKGEWGWNYTDLQQLYDNHEYRKHGNGTSLINRIKGNFSPNKFGIESFVNHTDPNVVLMTTDNHSMVDYLFWQDVRLNCNNYIVKIINDSIINSSGKPRDFQLDIDNVWNFEIIHWVNYTCS